MTARRARCGTAGEITTYGGAVALGVLPAGSRVCGFQLAGHDVGSLAPATYRKLPGGMRAFEQVLPKSADSRHAPNYPVPTRHPPLPTMSVCRGGTTLHVPAAGTEFGS